MSCYASVSISLDGYYTGLNPSPQQMLGEGGQVLHAWLPREVIDRPESGVHDIIAEEYTRIGAVVMGWDSYAHAETVWGAKPPFGVPVYVVTSRYLADDVRQGTTFRFINDGFEAAVEHAQNAAGDKEVGLHGGGAIRQGLLHGLLEELQLHLVPVLLGDGRQLFDGVDPADIQLEQLRAAEGQNVTHIKYRVRYD